GWGAGGRRRRPRRGSSSRRDRPRSRAVQSTRRGTLLRRMPPDEKPYRVYKGGRTKGKVPAPSRQTRAPRKAGLGRSRMRLRRSAAFRFGTPRRPPWRRIILLGLLALV